MKKNIKVIGFDKGYGLDKYAYFDDKGDLKYGKYMSVFSEAPSETEEDVLFFEGKKYYWGELALMEDSANIEDMNDYKSLEKFTPLSIALLFEEELKTDPKDIDALAIGLSLAQKDYADQYLKRIQKFKINDKVYDFKNKTFLVPQGIGAKYAIEYFFHKDSNEKPTYAILDIGQLTIDLVRVISGKVRRENAEGAAYEGVIKIVQELKEYIGNELNEVISLKEAQDALLKRKIFFYGTEKDLSDKIEELKRNYTKYIIKLVKERYKNIFKKFPKIYVVGGGSYYLDKEIIKEELGSNVNIFELLHENKNIPAPEYLNAIGNAVLIKRKLEESK
jgi:hypothetical protein